MKVFNKKFNSDELDINEIIEVLRLQQAPFKTKTQDHVSSILEEVFTRGDEAIKEFSLEFDGLNISSLEEARID